MDSNRSSYTSDIAFTPAVKALQEQFGSRNSYAKMEKGRGWQNEIIPPLETFISQRDSFYFATANSLGQPYIQHRGGPKGFLKVLDKQTLAFTDFAGNQQFVSIGNLSENPQVFLFLMDYPSRTRVKIWGEGSVEYHDSSLIESLASPEYPSRNERAIQIRVRAVDINCPQHIVPRFTEEEVQARIAPYESRITELETQLARLGHMGETEN